VDGWCVGSSPHRWLWRNPRTGPCLEVGEVVAAHCATTLTAAIAQEGAEAALQTREVIGQAKGLLMERHQLTADRAFERLSTASPDRKVTLRQIAEIVTSPGNLPA